MAAKHAEKAATKHVVTSGLTEASNDYCVGAVDVPPGDNAPELT